MTTARGLAVTVSLQSLAPRGFVTRGFEDAHVHTEACDDATQSAFGALEDAVERGLTWICFTAHVREDTDPSHVAQYVEICREAAEHFPDIAVLHSVETKLMNMMGDLDLPPLLDRGLLDTVHVADHRFPLDEPMSPAAIAELLEDRSLTEADAWEALTQSTCRALERNVGSILAHPFSIVPKVGLDADLAPDWAVSRIAKAASENDAVVEINNKWDSPTVALLKECARLEVPLVSASDAHHRGEVGRRAYTDAVSPELL